MARVFKRGQFYLLPTTRLQDLGLLSDVSTVVYLVSSNIQEVESELLKQSAIKTNIDQLDLRGRRQTGSLWQFLWLICVMATVRMGWSVILKY